MAQLTTTADTYEDLATWLGDKQSRKVSHNTYAERQGETIAVKLHATTILTFHSDETITLDSGGWRTVTTKDRMNAILPAPLYVSSVDGVWSLLRRGDGGGLVSEFYDGMRFDRHGEMVTDVLVDSGREMKRLKREISRYVKLYTDERVAELVDKSSRGGVAGDCWGCCMVDKDGQTVMGTDHLLDHMTEGYVMASLIVNALKHVGYQDKQVPHILRLGDLVRRAIRRYMVETLTVSHGARPAGRDGQTAHWTG